MTGQGRSSLVAEPLHIIEAQQFDRPFMETLFQRSTELKQVVEEEGGCDLLRNRVLVVLFYQPSTRTRLSFETAMSRMGGAVVSTENALEFSSHSKGESIEDTIQTVACYGDVVVLRHHQEGGVRRAARVSPVPVINAGDGPGQHPTQALLDMYTIRNEFGAFDGLTVALVGDLKYGRTVHSLAYLLAKYPVKKLYLVAPEQVEMPPRLIAHLQKRVELESCTDLEAVAGDVDVVYTTRLQQEYFEDPLAYQRSLGRYTLHQGVLAAMKEQAIILHPLPRNDEIPYQVDLDPRARYFQQVRNGLYLRMALLERVLMPTLKA
ncbi:MAG: aspartate carbamoyltransferase [Gammaproteobacteria bacterium]|nr:aspartate carbamoyltransferase [Gammaproteobacteria bacterium]